jgi:hypothetical protein
MSPTEAINLLSNMAAERVQDARLAGQGLTADLIELNRRAAVEALAPLVKAQDAAQQDAKAK